MPAAVLAPKPDAFSYVEAAAVPLPALSAFQALFDHGGSQRGGACSSWARRGGVGQFGVQLARARGAKVFTEEASEPVDLVFDTVGGERLALAPRRWPRAAGSSPSPRLLPRAWKPTTSSSSRTATSSPSWRPWPAEASLNVAIDSVYPLAEARAAFERSLARGKHGKVVLRVVDD